MKNLYICTQIILYDSQRKRKTKKSGIYLDIYFNEAIYFLTLEIFNIGIFFLTPIRDQRTPEMNPVRRLNVILLGWENMQSYKSTEIPKFREINILARNIMRRLNLCDRSTATVKVKPLDLNLKFIGSLRHGVGTLITLYHYRSCVKGRPAK